MSTASAQGGALDTIVDRMGLKTLVESCLVLEEGVASAKDIEVGMMMGAGILPGPFARAGDAGLDAILEQLENAQREWGDAFEPPSVLKRLVAQNRLGKLFRSFDEAGLRHTIFRRIVAQLIVDLQSRHA